MARLTEDKNLSVAMRRFAAQPLSGEDLAKIRTSLLGITQSQLGDNWGMSRNQISRFEKQPQPDKKTCDAYIGLMVRSLFGVNGTGTAEGGG